MIRPNLTTEERQRARELFMGEKEKTFEELELVIRYLGENYIIGTRL